MESHSSDTTSMDCDVLSSGISASGRRRQHRRGGRKTSTKSVKSEDDFDKEVEKLMPVWFWSNYYKSLEWLDMHKSEVSKGKARDVKYVKKKSSSEADKVGGEYDPSIATQIKEEVFDEKPHEFKIEKHETADEEDEDEGFELEMSEEMIKFFEQSFKHKLEMKKSKEKQYSEVEMEVMELKKAHEEREKEMKLLYGEGSCMIVGMETAVQLSFDKYCDMKSPKYWPNIPLNI